ncbi:MAG: DnaJ domain-containing protein [Wolbachia sp.]
MLIGYYEAGIERNATQNEIKKAYHKLAMEYHPGKNSDGAEELKNIKGSYRCYLIDTYSPCYSFSTQIL